MVCPHCQRIQGEGAPGCEICRQWLATQRLPSRDPYLGQLIAGRLRIVGILGEGGMGRVYLAEQPMGRTLRKVAVKTLHARDVNDPEIVARFERECGLVAQLEHPNTIQFFDFGKTPAGDLFIVMEYVEGQSLAEVMARSGPLPPERATLILRQIAGALEEAHSLGIVHRDLKPSNVMLTTRAGQADFVKVLDFGIAKRNTGPAGKESFRTQEGVLLGTPPYMSPEQFRGIAPDPRSDIYSLALMAYEMLTGARPFSAKNPWEWASAHTRAAPLPFEAQPSGAHLPYPMKRAILKALSKDPSDRQPSTRAFIDELSAPITQPAWPHPPRPWEGTAAMASPPPRAVPTTFPAPSEAASRAYSVPPVAPPPPAAPSAVFPSLAFQPSASPIPAAPPRERRPAPLRKAMAALVVAILAVPLILFAVIGSGAFSGNAKGPPSAPPRPTSPPPPVVPATAGPEVPKAPPSAASCPSGMVLVRGGAFLMGSNDGDADERPVHRREVGDFCMDRTEVTVSAYAQCARSGACTSASETVDWAGISVSDRTVYSELCNHDETWRGDHPVSCVDWYQARAYCSYRGARLPTEDEWEYAARNGAEGRTYPWGEIAPGPTLLNACGTECGDLLRRLGKAQRAMYEASDGFETSAPVGSFPEGRSAHGIDDLAGNVWEWTASQGCPYPGTACRDSSRVCRGGTWFNHAASSVRAANRYMVAPTARSFDIGFRCVVDR